MAYDYKPGEDDDMLRRYVIVVGVVLILAIIVVLILYLGLGITTEQLMLLIKRFSPDATNVTFVVIFVVSAFVLWMFFREPAAAEGVNRRQTYFLLLILLAALLVGGNFLIKRFAVPSKEVIKMERCPNCGGTGRAKLRPEYPCGECDGVGYVYP